jgi:hypothetical protein
MCKYPTKLYYNEESINKFNIFKDVIKNIRNIRNGLTSSAKIPLYKVIIYHNNLDFINTVKFFENVIKDEINCLEIEYNNLKDNLEYKIIPNMKTLGKKCRNNINTIKEKLIAMNISEKQDIIIDNYNITVDDYTIDIIPKIITSNMVSKIDNELMVSVDPSYTEELHNIYQISKLVSAVQNLRKKTKLNPWNKILINFNGNEILNNYINELSTRLLCDITINKETNNNIYAESKYEYEFFNNNIETIHFMIYFDQ